MGEKRHSESFPPSKSMGAQPRCASSARTKLTAEKAFRTLHPTATIVRPSLVFGPGDQFFAVSFPEVTVFWRVKTDHPCHRQRFAKLAKFLPFLPVFGGGKSRFQPVYVGDVAKAVEVVSRDDIEVVNQVGGKIIEAGGPEGTWTATDPRSSAI